ncbi:MAG: hypothetical protein HYV35_06790, partial [Lentisphaerae bacterium]|nr:hypothetical protein [Lentisphaerota bacterium]
MPYSVRRNKLCGLIDHVPIVITAALFVLAALPGRATTYTWNVNTTGDWSTAGNWTPAGPPTNGDDAVITNSGVSVLLSSASSNLSSLTLSRTITFTNWDTYLSATNVSILSNGLMTCVGPFSNSVMSNRVYVICSNITIAAGGSINVNSKGYSGAGSSGGGGAGQGPGGALGNRSSGSYGGVGGNYAWENGPVYGSAAAPEYAGSGGGYNSVNALRGGHGGGAVRIDALGTVTLNGLITANGEDNTSNNGGTGSGGGVWITCLVLTGAQTTANTCMILANGGSIATGGAGGSGGGGRIAILYDPTAQNALPVVPPLNLSVKG